ncbi:MAG: RkpR, polysaccharide export protein [Hoeflea sp.]|uniref:RkpR, polysaccharide export protein n=1 Tax=Hoeflea sp. TaxID=1940281 RepID=UPI0032EF7609
MSGPKPAIAVVKPAAETSPDKDQDQAASTLKDGSAVKAEKPDTQRPKNVQLLKELLNIPAAIQMPNLKKKSKLRGLLRLRHWAILISFIAVVLIPGALATSYMLFVAQDQYHSSSSFAVRSIENTSASDVLGMFTQSTAGSTVSDSYILLDYVRSEQMVKMVDKKFDLNSIYAVRGLDYYYALSPDAPIEAKLNFWNSIIQINFDQTSGIIDLKVRAFEPDQAREIADFIIATSEKLVNELSSKARNSVLESAHEEVYLAERRLSSARSALLAYRDRAQEVDPSEGAKMAAELIGSLELQLVQLNSSYATARSQMADDSPRVRLLRNQIASLEEQIRIERARLGSGTSTEPSPKTGRLTGSNDVASRIAAYEVLETDREFAERAYAAALTSLEKARMDANSRQRYLAVFLKPTTSELAQYPNRIFNSFLVTGILLFFWSIVLMGYYNIRDRN